MAAPPTRPRLARRVHKGLRPDRLRLEVVAMAADIESGGCRQAGLPPSVHLHRRARRRRPRLAKPPSALSDFFLNLTFVTRNPLSGLGSGRPSEVLSNAHGQAGVSTYDVSPSHLLMTTRGATSKPRCS